MGSAYSSGLQMNAMVSNYVGSGSTEEINLAKQKLVLGAAEQLPVQVLGMLLYKDTFKQHQETFQDLGIPIHLGNYYIYHHTGW